MIVCYFCICLYYELFIFSINLCVSCLKLHSFFFTIINIVFWVIITFIFFFAVLCFECYVDTAHGKLLSSVKNCGTVHRLSLSSWTNTSSRIFFYEQKWFHIFFFFFCVCIISHSFWIIAQLNINGFYDTFLYRSLWLEFDELNYRK